MADDPNSLEAEALPVIITESKDSIISLDMDANSKPYSSGANQDWFKAQLNTVSPLKKPDQSCTSTQTDHISHGYEITSDRSSQTLVPANELKNTKMTQTMPQAQVQQAQKQTSPAAPVRNNARTNSIISSNKVKGKECTTTPSAPPAASVTPLKKSAELSPCTQTDDVASRCEITPDQSASKGSKKNQKTQTLQPVQQSQKQASPPPPVKNNARANNSNKSKGKESMMQAPTDAVASLKKPLKKPAGHSASCCTQTEEVFRGFDSLGGNRGKKNWMDLKKVQTKSRYGQKTTARSNTQANIKTSSAAVVGSATKGKIFTYKVTSDANANPSPAPLPPTRSKSQSQSPRARSSIGIRDKIKGGAHICVSKQTSNVTQVQNPASPPAIPRKPAVPSRFVEPLPPSRYNSINRRRSRARDLCRLCGNGIESNKNIPTPSVDPLCSPVAAEAARRNRSRSQSRDRNGSGSSVSMSNKCVSTSFIDPEPYLRNRSRSRSRSRENKNNKNTSTTAIEPLPMSSRPRLDAGHPRLDISLDYEITSDPSGQSLVPVKISKNKTTQTMPQQVWQGPPLPFKNNVRTANYKTKGKESGGQRESSRSPARKYVGPDESSVVKVRPRSRPQSDSRSNLVEIIESTPSDQDATNSSAISVKTERSEVEVEVLLSSSKSKILP